MNHKELKDQLKAKTLEFEKAMEAGTSHLELIKAYKELKEMQYQILQSEIAVRSEKDLEIA
ncbi:MAG: hypothetical protein ACJ749_09300 [Flavisolibacter sp.]